LKITDKFTTANGEKKGFRLRACAVTTLPCLTAAAKGSNLSTPL